MIASVHGRVAALGPDGAVVEVGGVGLAVSCSPGTLARLRIGDSARLSTSLVVREDSLTLYGFSDDDERGMFELLQTANGVGPKLAQTILGVYPPREIRRAIATADYPSLVKVPGIGRKGAEKIVIELRDRIGPIDSFAPGAELAGVTAIAPWKDQVLHALAGLGFNGKEAAEAIELVAADAERAGPADNPEVAVILRRTIQLLGRTR
ncbi:MAG: Holliday junction branch migration protein RuvA [Actinomycetota bacterium]|nr:Holliday junction branch migration protein RuvA [Actinomycetota bacterium]MDQ2958185.1 Holliday junction branch migration protein RuvA [Actinomycetota bacterium]